MTDFVVCGYAAKTLRGEMEPKEALPAILLYPVLQILNRHGVENVPTDLAEALGQEIAEKCDALNTPENRKLFDEIISKHLERFLERKVYGRTIAD